MALAVCLFVFLPICRAQSDDADNGVAPAAQTAAQPQSAEADSAGTPTQPGVRVVRLSDVEGAVQILRGDQTQFPQAVMNMPLAQGTTVKTGQDGRAEIEFEDGSVARITPNSVLKIEELQTSSDGAMTTAVGQLSGLIYYELRSDPKSPFSVTFGDTTVTPTVNSTFRVNLATTPQEVAVIDGRVQVQDSSHSYLAEVAQGKTIQFQASGNAKYTVANWVAPNGFDDWNDQRDQEAANEAKNQTPARVQEGGGSIMDSGLGWSDLDNSGGWYPLPGYGMVWQPYGAGPGFDPYGNGMWADFGGGFGYSWVSGYPWGWLPFHCGSWSYIGSFGWGWMPGAYGCGGYGFGFGGYYGYGRYGHRGHYWRTNVYRGPSGYRAPVPPATVKGQPVQRIVRVGNQQPGMRTASLQNKDANRGNGRATHVNNAARPVKFNGTKIAPLHSMMAGVRVPTRNAALYNNYPAHAFQGNVRTALLDHNASTGHGNAPGFARGASGATRPGSFNIARGRSVATHPFGGANRPALGSTNRAAFGNSNRATFGGANRATFGGAGRSAFSQRNSFGSHGSFGGAHSPPSAGGFRSGGGFHSGSMGHSGGGFHGGGVSAGGGFHGGGGGGFQGGGGGGFHGGGGAVGGGGHTAH